MMAYDQWAVVKFPVDPELPPKFDCTANEARPAAQIKAWWDQPYATTEKDGRYAVYCLDGGAWDRPTFYGIAPTLALAKAMGFGRLVHWQSVRGAPRAFIDEGRAYVVRTPALPGSMMEVLHECSTFEEAGEFIQAMKTAAEGRKAAPPAQAEQGAT